MAQGLRKCLDSGFSNMLFRDISVIQKGTWFRIMATAKGQGESFFSVELDAKTALRALVLFPPLINDIRLNRLSSPRWEEVNSATQLLISQREPRPFHCSLSEQLRGLWRDEPS